MAENNLKAFLASSAIKVDEVDYVASSRFIDEKGEPIAWKIHPLTAGENEKILNQCKRKRIIPATREQVTETDPQKYSYEMVAAAVVFPNLNDANLQESYGVVGAVDLLKSMLTAGEFTDLFRACQEAAGFDAGMKEKIDAAKN